MKILLMPVQPRPRGMLATRVQRHLRVGKEALKSAALITFALVVGLAAALILACALALTLAFILAVAIASVAALVFMVVNPEGNLLFLVLLSQVWLFYAPRTIAPDRQPDGGLTMRSQDVVGFERRRSLAA